MKDYESEKIQFFCLIFAAAAAAGAYRRCRRADSRKPRPPPRRRPHKFRKDWQQYGKQSQKIETNVFKKEKHWGNILLGKNNEKLKKKKGGAPSGGPQARPQSRSRHKSYSLQGARVNLET